MLGKPFRSSLLTKSKPVSGSCDDGEASAKRQRINSDSTRTPELSGPRLVFKAPGISSLPRKPLVAVTNPAAAADDVGKLDNGTQSYYNVLWRKYTTKKHKTWDGDGVLIVVGVCLLAGWSTLFIGSKEVEIDSTLAKADYLAGRTFLKAVIDSKPLKEAPLASKPLATSLSKPKLRPQNKVLDVEKETAKKI